MTLEEMRARLAKKPPEPDPIELAGEDEDDLDLDLEAMRSGSRRGHFEMVSPVGDDLRLNFGKHKDRMVSELIQSNTGRDYLDWISTKASRIPMAVVERIKTAYQVQIIRAKRGAPLKVATTALSSRAILDDLMEDGILSADQVAEFMAAWGNHV